MCDHSPNREAEMVTIERDENGKATVWCDPCIAPLVKALNDGGLPTVASCCGHNGRGGGGDLNGVPGVISLRDGRQLLILPDLAAALSATACALTEDARGEDR